MQEYGFHELETEIRKFQFPAKTVTCKFSSKIRHIAFYFIAFNQVI